MRTRVKICGFTRPEDALAAARLGADAIGLVFYSPSPRHVSIETAAEIAAALPAFVSVVGLFVDAERAWIERVLQQVPIDCLQFHGDEAPEDCRIYRKPYIRAIRMRGDTDLALVEKRYADAAGLLLDAYHPGAPGGTGSGFDWELIPRTCALPVILAGGLSPDNAAQAVRQVQPYALDVSSGVEADKGIKDVAKMAEFIRKTNRALEHDD
ncbi:phosphoribosylanthranilate isomerase [Methylomonas sp. MgM2]